MPWLLSRLKWAWPLVLVGLTLAQSDGPYRLELADGSQVTFSESMMVGLELTQREPHGTLIYGRFRNKDAMYAIWFQIKNLAEVEGPETLPALLNEPGLELQRVEDSTGKDNRDIFRIANSVNFGDMLCTFRKRSQFQRGALFVLIGDESDFYEVLPRFTSFAESYQPTAFQANDPMFPSLGLIVAGIGLLVASVVLIWLVFRKVAITEDNLAS